MQQVLIVHTSGSTSLEVLSVVHDKSGVFYPLQTFSYEREIDWTTTPVFVEAVNNHDLDLLTSLAGSLTQKVYQYSSQQRQTLHMAAVLHVILVTTVMILLNKLLMNNRSIFLYYTH